MTKRAELGDQEVDTLLARGRLSGAQREAILDTVLKATAATPAQSPWRWRPWAWMGSGVVAVAAAVLLVLLPASPPEDGFRSRGSQKGELGIDVGCQQDCQLGGTLLFRVQRVMHPLSLAAFAVTPTGQRIWYFPTDTGESPLVPVTEKAVVLSRGVALTPPHEPGAMYVHLVLSPEPLTRAQVDALLAAPALPEGMLHLQQPVTIVP